MTMPDFSPDVSRARKVVVQPAGSAAAQAHFADTILKKVPHDRLLPYLSADQAQSVRAVFGESEIPVWGVTRGGNDRNFKLFERVRAGDVLIFARRRRVVASAPVLLTLVNRQIAVDLWGTDEDGSTWENLMLLGEVVERDITYEEFNAGVGYKRNALLQDFRVLDEAKSELALALIEGGATAPIERTYLLTWNPSRWEWTDRDRLAERVQGGESVVLTWSSGNTKSIPVGSRVFLLQQGDGSRGLIASGWTVANPEEGPHWNSERAAEGVLSHHVKFELERLLPASAMPVSIHGEGDLAPVLEWSPAASGQSVSGGVAANIEKLWSESTIQMPPVANPVDPELAAVEGEQRQRLVWHRRREGRLREAKIAQARASDHSARLRCEVPGCGFDFVAVYGMLGEGYAQVHHLRQLSDADEPVRTTLADLAVVCANCHAMIHRGGANRPLTGLISNSNLSGESVT